MKFDDIKDPFVGVNEAGVYEGVLGYEVKETKGDGGKSQKLMLVVTATVTSPTAYVGATKSDYIVVGTDADERRKLQADPLAALEATWAAKAGALKDLMVATGWPKSQEIVFTQDGHFPKVPKALLEFLSGKKVWFSVKQEREPLLKRDGSPNDRAGQVNGRIGKWLKPGTPGVALGVSEVQMEPVDYTKPATAGASTAPGIGIAPEPE